MPRFVRLYQVPLSGASLAAGTKFILIRMRFLVLGNLPSNTPTPTKCFSQLAQSAHLTVTCWLPDDWRQLSGNSWVDTVAGLTLGPERKQQQVGVKAKDMEVLARGWGCLRQTLGRIKISTWEEISACLTAPFAGISLLSLNKWINVWVKRAKTWGSVKQNTGIYFTHKDDRAPSESFRLQGLEVIWYSVCRPDSLRQMLFSNWVKKIIRFRNHTCWILLLILPQSWWTLGTCHLIFRFITRPLSHSWPSFPRGDEWLKNPNLPCSSDDNVLA